MKKKFICTVCGYIHEGNEAPEKCPMCGVPASKFKELSGEADLNFVAEHEIGVAKGCDAKNSGKVSRIISWANAPRWACIWP